MRLLAVVSYFAFFCSGTAVARQGYTNPVRDSNGDMVRVADPFVYRHGGVYYLIGTTRQHNGFDCYTRLTWCIGLLQAPLTRSPTDITVPGRSGLPR